MAEERRHRVRAEGKEYEVKKDSDVLLFLFK